MDSLSAQKANLRHAMKARRALQDPAEGQRLAELVLASGLIAPHAIIGGFMPMRGEIDIRPLLHILHKNGHAIALPQTPPVGQRLIFRVWTPEAKMQPGRFGTYYPDTPLLEPNFLLIPLLAFDLMGNRLGYGGGYYDRTIAALPNAFRLGCAYAMQQTAHVPTEPTDQPLHAVATETKLIRF